MYLRAILPNFSNLQEIQLDNYSQLTALPNLSNLKYLRIGCEEVEMDPTDSNTLYTNLLQIFFDNRHTLRAVTLYDIQYSGLRSWSVFLNILSLSTNLIELELRNISLLPDLTNHWDIIGNDLKLLIVLELSVSLYDTGFESLCAGLFYHPSIKRLLVRDDKLTFLSCEPLIYLIPTVTQLEKLEVPGIYKDMEGSNLLKQKADEYSIELRFSNK